MSVNKVFLSGRLTQDPKISSSQNGLLIANFSIAVNEYYNGNERTSFFECVGFAKTAERIEKLCSKGLLVFVDGVLRQEVWENREGGKRSRINVIVNRIEVFGNIKKSEGQNFDQNNEGNHQSQKDPYFDQNYNNDFGMENDIPF